jgi:predicted ATPase
MHNPNPNLIAITGAPGAGKTSLLSVLANRGYACVPEVARQIIQEQQAAGGNALPWSDTTAYLGLMLTRSVDSYLQHQHAHRPTFFDRGLPDSLGYARLICAPNEHEVKAACDRYRYASIVFAATPWHAIYATDDQRKQTFDEAITSFQHVLEAYHACGYRTVLLPEATPEERADFVLSYLS